MTRGTSHPHAPKGESQRRALGRKRRRSAENVALAQRADPVCVSKTSFPLLSSTSTLLGWSGAALNGECGEQKMVTRAIRSRRGNSEGWSRSMANSRAWSSPVKVCHLRSH